MTTPRGDIRRFTDPAPGVAVDRAGRLVTTGMSPEEREQAERLNAIADAWRLLDTTGDRSALVELGILPPR